MQTSAQVLRKRMSSLARDLTVRHELNKIKNEDTLETAVRQNRIVKERRQQILDKHIRDLQKLEELKRSREDSANQSREVMIKTAQERDRLRLAVLQAAQSPTSLQTKELLNELRS
jgi:hypothetical protein